MIARVGLGLDSHPYDRGRPCWLAGLLWTNSPGLAGHTDGDAVCHAMSDALLSAAALGDLGAHFGVDSPDHRDASSLSILAEVAGHIRSVGFEIRNVSACILGNSPRLGGRRAEAESILSRAVGAPVMLSATTTDGLGFPGRGEGLSVTAVALVNQSATGAAQRHRRRGRCSHRSGPLMRRREPDRRRMERMCV